MSQYHHVFTPHFHVFFWLFLIVFLGCVDLKEYKMKLISFEKCKIPENRLYKTPPLRYTLSAKKLNRNTTVINVKFSIFSREGPVFLTVRGYQVQQSLSKDLIFNLEKVDCKHVVTVALIKLLSVTLDKNCYAMPGNYSADNVNIEDFNAVLTKAMIGPGRYAYDVEFLTNKGVAACLTITCDIVIKK